jgi:hypothetical protein
MPTDLVPLPPIPVGLREASVIGRLILFVGAGASRLAGCPGWNEFADGALHQLVDRGRYTHAQLDQIKALNPRIKLSIATAIAEETQTTIDYDQILHSTPREEHRNGRRLYSSLFSLGNIFVTTNYDRWLDTRIDQPQPGVIPVASPATLPPGTSMRSIYAVNDFLPVALTQHNTVIHLHGSVANPMGMVLTTNDYIEHYANDHRTGNPSTENRVLTFLEHLFEHYTVLFVGYGLEELEILEYVILKARKLRTTSNEARHFLLQGFFSHETTLLRSMEGYYLRECGIQLIPFLRDQRNWDQLLDVLEDFARQMPASAPLILERVEMLEALAREMEQLP